VYAEKLFYSGNAYTVRCTKYIWFTYIAQLNFAYICLYNSTDNDIQCFQHSETSPSVPCHSIFVPEITNILSELFRVAITKYYTLGVLVKDIYFSQLTRLGSLRSKYCTNLVSDKGSHPGSKMVV
jgi:hypothetical protein